MALTKEKLKELFAAGEFDQYLPDPVVTWASITGKPSTFPPSTHNHTKAQITDFPTSMPASDVYAWAKAATKPSYTHTEVGAAASSHTHTKANITDFPTSMPASDVYAWAKAATKPSYTHTEVGAAASSHNHNAEYLQGFGLGYISDYGEVVIGLCEMTNTNPNLHSGVTGEFTAMRTNGLYDPYVIRVAAQKIYNTTNERARWYRDANVGGTVTPVYFNYGGKRYFGFKFYPAPQQVASTLSFKGEWWGTKPFMVEYKNQTTIKNSEINNSLVNASNGEVVEDVKITSVNYTSYAQKKITSGTAAPSGGVDGDFYVQY